MGKYYIRPTNIVGQIVEKWNSICVALDTTAYDINNNDIVYIITPDTRRMGYIKRIVKDSIFIETEESRLLHDSGVLCEVQPQKMNVRRSASKLIDTSNITFSLADGISIYKNADITLLIDGDFKFIGSVVDIKDTMNIECNMNNIISEFTGIFIHKMYYDMTLEQLIKNIIEEYTDYTVSYSIDTITIERFPAVGNLLDVLKILLSAGGYILYTKEFNIELRDIGREYGGEIDNNYIIKNVEYNTSDIKNSIYLEGADRTAFKTETFTGDGTTTVFTLQYPIYNTTTVKVDGSEVNVLSYTVDKYAKTITFNTPPVSNSNIEVNYDYTIPLLVHITDDESIEKYGERSIVLREKWVEDMELAVELARKYLNQYSQEFTTVELETVNTKYEVGKVYKIKNKQYNIDDNLICKDVEYTNKTHRYKFGRVETDIFNKYTTINDKIQELEQKFWAYQYINKAKSFIEQDKINIRNDFICSVNKTIRNPLDVYVRNGVNITYTGYENKSAPIGVFVAGKNTAGEL